MPDEIVGNYPISHDKYREVATPPAKKPAETQTKYSKSPPPEVKMQWADRIYESLVSNIHDTLGPSASHVTRAVILELFPLDSPEQKAQSIYKSITDMRTWAKDIIATGDKAKIEDARNTLLNRVGSNPQEETEIDDVYTDLGNALNAEEQPPPHA